MSEPTPRPAPSPSPFPHRGGEGRVRGGDEEVLRRLRRMSRRGFTIGAAGAVAGLAALGWLKYFAPAVGGIPWPLRWAHELNEGLSRAAFSTGRLAPTYPASAAVEPRVNGTVGLAAALDADRWRLHVEDDRGGALRLSLADVRALPRTEVVTELRCV